MNSWPFFFFRYQSKLFFWACWYLSSTSFYISPSMQLLHHGSCFCPFLTFFNPNYLSIQRLAALMRLLFRVLFLVIRCLIAPFTSTDLSWSTFMKIMPSLVCPCVINLFTSPVTSCSSGVLSTVLLTAVEILSFLTSFTSTSTFNLANISSLWLMPLTFCCAFSPYTPSSLLLMASNLNLMFTPSFSHFYETFLA